MKFVKRQFDKAVRICCVLSIFAAVFTVMFAPMASAAIKIEAREGNACKEFLGIVSWDCDLKTNIENEDDLRNNIIQIVANIAKDIAVIATYLVLGYVIYGGYQYTFSGGDPGKVANGKKTLAQAFIGLAITMSASIIMDSIRIALVGGTGDIGECASGGCVKPGDMVTNLVGWVIGVAGVVSAVFLVYGGIQYMTASGDPGKLKKAKDTILYSAIGMVIVGLAIATTAFVSNVIREAENIDNSTTNTNTNTNTNGLNNAVNSNGNNGQNGN